MPDKQNKITKILIIGICVMIFILALTGVYRMAKNKAERVGYSSSSKMETTEVPETVDEKEIKYKDVSPNSLYYISNDSVIKMCAFGDGIVVLTNSSTIYLDARGNSAVNTLKYKSPVMIVDGNSVLVYDKEGTGYRIEDDTGVVDEFTAPGNIYTMDYLNDYIAVAYNDNIFTSVFKVINPKGTEIYSANLADEYIINVKITPDCNAVTIGAVNSADAEIYSIIRTYQFDYNTEFYTLTKNGETIVAIYPQSASKITFVTDCGFYGYEHSNNTETAYQSYSIGSLRAVMTDSGTNHIAIVTAQYGNNDYEQLALYKKNGSLVNTVALKGNAKNFNNGSDYLSINYGNSVETYTFNGSLIGTSILDSAKTLCIPSGSSLYVLSDNSLYILSAKGNYKAVEATVDNDVTVTTTTAETTTEAKEEGKTEQ